MCGVAAGNLTGELWSPAIMKAPTATWLRAEGLALGLLCAWLYYDLRQPWWIFAVLFLAPDLSMLGYLRTPRIGAIAYNAVHSWALVVVLYFLSRWFWRESPFLLSLPFILGAHIGFDRALGYGLKLPTNFYDTDLGRIGKTARG
jgi:hypothetical protein